MKRIKVLPFTNQHHQPTTLYVYAKECAKRERERIITIEMKLKTRLCVYMCDKESFNSHSAVCVWCHT